MCWVVGSVCFHQVLVDHHQISIYQLDVKVMEKIRSKKLEPVCDCKKDCVRWIGFDNNVLMTTFSVHPSPQIALHIERPESRATWTAKLWVLGEKEPFFCSISLLRILCTHLKIWFVCSVSITFLQFQHHPLFHDYTAQVATTNVRSGAVKKSPLWYNMGGFDCPERIYFLQYGFVQLPWQSKFLVIVEFFL